MNEPRINLRQVSTRIEVEDYAKIVQLLACPANGYKDIAAYVRTVIHNREMTQQARNGNADGKRRMIQFNYS